MFQRSVLEPQERIQLISIVVLINKLCIGIYKSMLKTYAVCLFLMPSMIKLLTEIKFYNILPTFQIRKKGSFLLIS